jgi:hypothetical protein
MKMAAMIVCSCPSAVMAGHSASKDARKRAYLPAIHAFLEPRKQDVDARDKRGHDDVESITP